jgi:hypothetical protein
MLMTISKELQALRDHTMNPKDGQDSIQLAADALIALEPSLASKGDQVMAILLLAVGGSRKERGEFTAHGV